MNTAHTDEKKPTIVDHLINFLTRYRRTLVVILIVLAVAAVALFVTLEIRSNRIERSLEQVEALQEQFAEWRALDDEVRASEFQAFFDEAQQVVDSFGRLYAGQRALLLQARALEELERLEEAADIYVDLAERFPDSYLAPIALMQAAIALEDSGAADDALAQLSRIVDEYDEVAEVPRALFSIGRIYETQDNIVEAVASYNRLIDDYPGSSWTNLARNRIITLSVEGRIGS